MSPLNAAELCTLVDRHADPVLVWLDTADPNEAGSPASRIELSGPVARRWIAKTDNFMSSEFPFGGSKFVVLLRAHWRSPFWLIGAWLRGMTLVEAREASGADMVVSNDVDVLVTTRDEGGPDALIAQTQDSLALAWPSPLPPEILDGTADVMSFGDWVENPMTAPGHAHLVSKQIDWLPPHVWEHPEELTLPLDSLRGVDLLGKIVDVDGIPLEDPGLLSGKRVLVTTGNLVLFTAQLLQLWLAGARVIWAPKPADPETKSGEAIGTGSRSGTFEGSATFEERIAAERFDYRLAN